MSDQDRGAYTPHGDAPLAFDARRQSGGGAPAPMTLIISAMILLVLIAAIFFFYRSGIRAEDGAPRPVGSAVNDIKAAPPAGAQPSDPAAGLQIYHAENGQADPATAAAPTFAPAPEQPLPRPVAPPPTQPVTSAGLKPAQAATAPAAPQPSPPTAIAAAAISSPKPAVTTVAAAKGGAVVQIGAFSSAALADKGWNDAARVAPGAAAGKGKRVEEVDKGGTTLYRTSVTGFGSRPEAEAFCITLKAAGKSCFVK